MPLRSPNPLGLPSPQLARAREGHRQFAVRLIFFIYILSLVEGPLRKWLLPGLATPIYFLRDPFVLFLYAYCLHRNLVATSNWWKIWLGFAAIASLLGGFPYMLAGYDPRAWLIGVRAYWLYMPIAFVVASTVRHDDLRRFIRLNLLLAAPYAALVIAQYKSPVHAWINGGISGEEDYAMVANDVVRPYGLFTYTGQNVIFSAFLFAMALSLLIDMKDYKAPLFLSATGGVSVACIAVLSGSRSIYMLLGATLLVTVLGAYLTNSVGRALRTTIVAAGFCMLAAYLFVEVFTDAFQAMQVRMEQTAGEGPIEKRALFDLLGWTFALRDAPILGEGIGLGIPVVGRLVDRPFLEFSESELMRNTHELGVIIGVMFVMLRFAFAAHLVRVAFRAARAGYPGFLPFAGYAAVTIGVSQLTFSTINAFFFWFAAGLVLSSVKGATAGRLSSSRPGAAPRGSALLKDRRPAPAAATEPAEPL